MPTGVTKIADVIQPELFTQYVIDKTTEKSELMNAGVIVHDPRLDELVTGGGTIITMPMWNDLDGESQVLSDGADITADKITAKKELATMLIRGKAWASHELAGALAGDDPMKAIVELVSDWWVRDEKKQIISILKGVFASTAMSDHVLDITSLTGDSAVISGNAVLDAKQLLGDASGQLSMIYMHSAVFTLLQKQNLISYIPTARGEISIPTYLGYRVIMDDSIPAESGKYTTYLLSAGAISRGIGTPVSLTPTETDRDSLASTDYLINRQAKVLHPRGISWVGASKIAGSTPSNTELATGTNWERVLDGKKIGMVKLIHYIEAPKDVTPPSTGGDEG